MTEEPLWLGWEEGMLRGHWDVQKAQDGWTLSHHILTILAPPSLAWIPIIVGLLLHFSWTLSEPGMTLFTPKYEKPLSQVQETSVPSRFKGK